MIVEVAAFTTQELDDTADAFAALVSAGVDQVVGEFLQSLESHRPVTAAVDPEEIPEEGEEEEAEVAPEDADILITLWLAYMAAVLIPALLDSMTSASVQESDALAMVGVPVADLLNEPISTEKYLVQAENRLRGVGDLVWNNAREVIIEGLAEGDDFPMMAARIAEEVPQRSKPQAETIARTESNTSRNAVAEQTRQRAGVGLPPNTLRKQWQNSDDTRVRLSHVEADGQEVGLGDRFQVGASWLLFPGDPLGLPEDTINCVTGDTVVDYPSLRGVTRRWYVGNIIEISFSTGNKLSVTPNHPVLRSDGVWCPAGELVEGDNCIYDGGSRWFTRTPDKQVPPAMISQIYSAACEFGDTKRVSVSPPDFHGDGTNSDVNIVPVFGDLNIKRDAATDQEITDFGLALADMGRIPVFNNRAFQSSTDPVRSACGSEVSTRTPVSVGRFGEVPPRFLAHTGHADTVSFTSSTFRKTQVAEVPINDVTTDLEFSCHREDASALLISLFDEFGIQTDTPVRPQLARVTNVNVTRFSGHVYNLDTGVGWYNANGITTRNCRCVSLTIVDTNNLPSDGTITASTRGDDTMPNYTVRREGWSDFPVADDTREWDGNTANQRLSDMCGINDDNAGEDEWGCYAEGFLYRDDDADPQTKAAYKLGVLDVVEGQKTVIPRGVFAVAGALEGARGGVDVPPDDEEELRATVTGLYELINERLDTDHEVPWGEPSTENSPVAASAGARFVPVSGHIVLEGRKTGDRRVFGPQSLTWQTIEGSESLEIPIGYQFERSHGGAGSDKVKRVGRVDTIERTENGLFAQGVIDMNTEYGPQVVDAMGTKDNPGTLAGVSVIVDEDPDGEGLAVEVDFPEHCDMDSENPECFSPESETITQGARIRAVDLVDIPAFSEARLYLAGSTPEEDDTMGEAAEDSIQTDTVFDAPSFTTASAASAISDTPPEYTITLPKIPPRAWFTEPEEDPDIGAITITDEGRIYGYLAPKGVAHRGIRDKRVEAPMRNVDYTGWMNRVQVTDNNGSFERIPAGPLTMDCGHASANPSMIGQVRTDHYDNTCSVVATACVGENAKGVWIAGSILPDVSSDQVARMMACQLSGDWGPHREKPGKRELHGALFVPVPGFARRTYASLQLTTDGVVHTRNPLRFVVKPEPLVAFGARYAAQEIASRLHRARREDIIRRVQHG